MEVSPTKLAVACLALFGGIVALNFISQYRSNEEVRERLSNLNLDTIRPRLFKQEGLSEAGQIFPEFITAEEAAAIQQEDSEPILKED